MKTLSSVVDFYVTDTL